MLYHMCSIKDLQNSQENIYAGVSFLVNCGLKVCSFITTETPAQVLFCEYNEIFKNTFFTEKPHCFCTSMQIVFSRSSNQHKEMLFHLLRSSQRKYSLKKGVLENFAISTGKYLCCSHFLVMLQTFRPATLIRRDSNIGIFLWVLRNFCEYFKNTHFEKILQTTSSVFNLLSH